MSFAPQEANRALKALDEMIRARKQGHELLVDHAEAVIDEALKRPHPTYRDYDGIHAAGSSLFHGANALARLFDVPVEWGRLGEELFIIHGQRSPKENKKDKQTWNNVVINPMRAHHARLLGEMQECRTELWRSSQIVSETVKPIWDPQRRELKYGNAVVKQFRQRAKNQEKVLAAFHKRNWRARIEDPLPADPDIDTRQRLADAVRGLNCNDHIIFELDGTSRGVLWKPRTP
jgi:hypothetical protein